MYIDTAKTTLRGKTYTRYLLRESFRENGKVKHRTLANLSKVPDDVISILKAALKGELIPENQGMTLDTVGLKQGPSFGAVFVLASIAKRLKISQAFGHSPFNRHLIWLMISRIIDQGSRLSASRLQNRHATKEVLGLEEAALHKLYQALDWAADNQEAIEKRLFKSGHESKPPKLFLYDVTSSYLEGTDNELSAWGYNRDKKKGKKQIVIGLLTDDSGDPVAVRVFEGNTSDTTTCLDQIKLLAESFGVKNVTLVGDRGMIKTPQIEALKEQEFQLDECTSDECIVQIGELAQVEQIVAGSISRVGTVYSIAARIISVETGHIIKTAIYDTEGNIGDLLKTGMHEVAAQLAGDEIISAP